MDQVGKEVCFALKEITIKVLGNNRDTDLVDIVENMLHKFQALGCSIFLKIHF